MNDCKHESVSSIVLDQTLGVECNTCYHLLAYCWMDEHLPESLWNKACINDVDCNVCDEDRDDYCVICRRQIVCE